MPLDAAGTEYLSFAPGISGWAKFATPTRQLVFVRFGQAGPRDALPKIVAREAYVAFPEGVGPRALRDLPIVKLEAAVNQPAYYSEALKRLPPENAVMIPFPWRDDADWWFAKPAARVTGRVIPQLRLDVPEGRPKPDEFYERVAEVFSYLTTVSQRPATDLAEANDVNATTVHGWVKEARRRGLLPSGERSRRKE